MPPMAYSRSHQLLSVLGDAREILVVSHFNPDPDCLASAAGIATLIRLKLGKSPLIIQSGTIGRAENRAMVSVLGISLAPAEEALDGFQGAIVLVDTQPGRRNNPLPSDLRPAAVIDHHPDWGNTGGVPFVDLRQDYGATSTIITEYLQELEVPIDSRLATALFFGISSETQRFARETMSADIVASQFLFPYVDKRLLGVIETPTLTRSYFHLMVDAVRSTVVCDNVVVTILGSVPYSDAVAEVADLFVRLEDANWAVCLARHEDSLVVSLRTVEANADAGPLLASILPFGTAGGHAMTAGGRIPLGCGDWVVTACELVKRLLGELCRRGRDTQWLAGSEPPAAARETPAARLLAELPLAVD